MRLYFAGNLSSREHETNGTYLWGVRDRLLSFAYKDDWGRGAFDAWIERPDFPTETRVFLDSGAFTAWSRGDVIDIKKYCEYIHQHTATLTVCACLDVIGDWKGSARNLDIMLANGLRPMAVFHRGSPWTELHRLASLGLPLALGGLVGGGKSVTSGNIQIYLDACWARLKDHWPIQVHLFGVIAQWALERYPWFSADSSTSIVSGGMGRVQTWTGGHVVTDNWITYARRTLNGRLVDGVALNRSKNGSAHLGRREFNVQCQLALERHVTDLWTSRGVTWDGNTYTGIVV